MSLFDWFRPTPRPMPDIDRLQRCVDAVDTAADIAFPHLFGGHRKHIIQTVSNAQTMADFYAASWLREEVDAELFALEAAIAEESVPRRPSDERVPGECKRFRHDEHCDH